MIAEPSETKAMNQKLSQIISKWQRKFKVDSVGYGVDHLKKLGCIYKPYKTYNHMGWKLPVPKQAGFVSLSCYDLHFLASNHALLIPEELAIRICTLGYLV